MAVARHRGRSLIFGGLTRPRLWHSVDLLAGRIAHPAKAGAAKPRVLTLPAPLPTFRGISRSPSCSCWLGDHVFGVLKLQRVR